MFQADKSLSKYAHLNLRKKTLFSPGGKQLDSGSGIAKNAIGLNSKVEGSTKYRC